MTQTLIRPDTEGTTAPRRATVAPHGSPTGVAQHYAQQTKERSRWAAALEFAFWVPLALVVAFFLADGGMYDFGSIAAAFTSIGVLTGLLGTAGVCVMLILAARVPLIDKTLGQVKATELHAKYGQWTIIALLQHAAFTTVGYSLADGKNVIAEFASLWSSTMDFVWAVIGMVLFLAVSVSSIATARKKLPYEAWHVIHLLSYVGTIAAIPHMFSMSSILGGTSVQHWYFIALLSLTGILLFVYRLVMPIINTLDHNIRVTRVVRIAPDTINIEMSGRRLEELGAQGGQYFHWRFLAPGFWWHQHPFSLSAAPTNNSLRITVRALGNGSAALADLRPGTRVGIEGPYGIFSDASRTKEAAVFVGAGVGIAPIRSIIESTAIAPGRAAVILRASTEKQVYLLEEIREICARRGITLAVLTGSRKPGGWVPASRPNLKLTDIAPYLKDADVFVCGPNDYTEIVTEEARTLGVPAEQIHDERFNW
ncbi:MAG: ferredoxin reductase family protein [Propionibacteriaceae bacterium]|nr:ferric reductase-like transmembrane domain-containing protein [Micropruina sp.]